MSNFLTWLFCKCILFERITPRKVYFLETTLSSYLNSKDKAHFDDYKKNMAVSVSTFSLS